MLRRTGSLLRRPKVFPGQTRALSRSAGRNLGCSISWGHCFEPACSDSFLDAPAKLARPSPFAPARFLTSAPASQSLAEENASVSPSRSDNIDVKLLAEGVLSGDRNRLSRAITLVESQNPKHREQAEQLLDILMRQVDHTKGLKTVRIGISGAPGAGKSTFIEAFGMYLIRQGHSVAVLSIDPSSTFTGGSILGDKTRMANLSLEPKAFIRPSPSQGVLGGVAPATAETIELCTASGYDFIIVETVGVGQSEINVVNLVDMNVLLVSPVSGDELQGIKKGIVEIADLVIVNKADGALKPAARHTKVQYMHALQMLAHSVSARLGWEHKRGWSPSVTRCSSIDEDPNALAPIKEVVDQFHTHMVETSQLLMHRRAQKWRWVWVQLQHEVVLRAQQLQKFQQKRESQDPELRAKLPAGAYQHGDVVRHTEEEIMRGELTVRAAADRLLTSVMHFGDAHPLRQPPKP